MRVESAATEEGSEGVYILDPQKLAVAVLLMCLSELPTLGRNFRPVRMQLAENHLSEVTRDFRPLSELLMLRRNFRPKLILLG